MMAVLVKTQLAIGMAVLVRLRRVLHSAAVCAQPTTLSWLVALGTLAIAPVKTTHVLITRTLQLVRLRGVC